MSAPSALYTWPKEIFTHFSLTPLWTICHKVFLFKEEHWICKMPMGYFLLYCYFTKTKNSAKYILRHTASHNKPPF